MSFIEVSLLESIIDFKGQVDIRYVRMKVYAIPV
jgi:hypothetical protein